MFRSDVVEPDEQVETADIVHTTKELDAHSVLFSKGSEDMIVPNSPEDEDERPTLELSKFLFAG